jgi:hypothetical protein
LVRDIGCMISPAEETARANKTAELIAYFRFLERKQACLRTN